MQTIIDGLYNINFLVPEFYILLALVVLIYWLIGGEARKVLLLITSVLFYYSNGWISLITVLLISVFSFIVALLLDRRKSAGVLLIGILLCLSPFLLYRFSDRGTINIAFYALGVSYTSLMAVGYLVDIYNGKVEKRFSPIEHFLFIMFFPYAVSGPIERSKHMQEQFSNIGALEIDYSKLQRGIIFILWGLFAKMVVADRVAVPVNTVFSDFRAYNGTELAFTLILWGLEIYFDFTAISTIACGISMLFGIDIIENFNKPYFSLDITDFWRRWHISFSQWLRDYVYIPLGGNKKGTARQFLNIMITFIISGLWHGFHKTFLLWGLLHGIYNVIEKSASLIGKHFNIRLKGARLLRIIICFIAVDYAWLYFKIDNLSDAFFITIRIVTTFDISFFNFGWLNIYSDSKEWAVLWLGVFVIFAVDVIEHISKKRIADIVITDGVVTRILIYGTLAAAVLIFGMYGATFDASTFIYGGF